MDAAFYVAGAISILATIMVITRLNVVHALLYLIVSLLAVSVVFYTLGAPFLAALEVIIYAGAIMVLFVFVVMMLSLGKRSIETEQSWLNPKMWIGPGILALLLLAEVAYVAASAPKLEHAISSIGPKQVAIALFGPYFIGVELASIILLGALVGAYHLGARKREEREERETQNVDWHAARTDSGGDLVLTGADRSVGAP